MSGTEGEILHVIVVSYLEITEKIESKIYDFISIFKNRKGVNLLEQTKMKNKVYIVKQKSNILINSYDFKIMDFLYLSLTSCSIQFFLVCLIYTCTLFNSLI